MKNKINYIARSGHIETPIKLWVENVRFGQI